jgi:hypothetical protein
MVYKQVKINITKAQLDKALKGKPVQFSASQIGSGDSYLSLHPANVKIVEKAAMKGSGCVVNLAEGELLATHQDMDGAGIFSDIWKGLKSAYRWTKQNVVDTDFYQKSIKPVIRQGVDQGANILKGKFPQAANLIDSTVNTISDKTGAFGVKGRKTKAQKKQLLIGKGLYLS